MRDWMGIETPIQRPANENPKRPIEGFACTRSEVSGPLGCGICSPGGYDADAFFARHFVANYCPLAFFDNGRNVTPDKLPAAEAEPLYAACDAHLRALVSALDARWVIGVGAFAEARAAKALRHPTYASAACCIPARRARPPTAAGARLPTAQLEAIPGCGANPDSPR